MNIKFAPELLTALRTTHEWCKPCSASGDLYNGHTLVCPYCNGKAYKVKEENALKTFKGNQAVMVRIEGQWIAATVSWPVGKADAYHVEFDQTFVDSEDYCSSGAIVYASADPNMTEIKEVAR